MWSSGIAKWCQNLKPVSAVEKQTNVATQNFQNGCLRMISVQFGIEFAAFDRCMLNTGAFALENIRGLRKWSLNRGAS